MFICRHAKGVHARLSKYLKGCMLTCRNAEGVHGQRKIGNPELAEQNASQGQKEVTN